MRCPSKCKAIVYLHISRSCSLSSSISLSAKRWRCSTSTKITRACVKVYSAETTIRIVLALWLTSSCSSSSHSFHTITLQAASGLQKRHATQSKAYDRKMKKLSIRDETVQEAFRRNTAVSGELRDMQDRKAADKRLAKKLEKMEKEALTEARHSVVMNGRYLWRGLTVPTWVGRALAAYT